MVADDCGEGDDVLDPGDRPALPQLDAEGARGQAAAVRHDQLGRGRAAGGDGAVARRGDREVRCEVGAE